MSLNNLKIEIGCSVHPKVEQYLKEKSDATPEADKRRASSVIDYNPVPSDWMKDKIWSMAKAVAIVQDNNGEFTVYPRMFKKGDIVYFFEEHCSARIAGAKPYPMIVITDQKRSHVKVQCRYVHERDNELADQFINPKNLRYVDTQ